MNIYQRIAVWASAGALVGLGLFQGSGQAPKENGEKDNYIYFNPETLMIQGQAVYELRLGPRGDFLEVSSPKDRDEIRETMVVIRGDTVNGKDMECRFAPRDGSAAGMRNYFNHEARYEAPELPGYTGFRIPGRYCHPLAMN